MNHSATLKPPSMPPPPIPAAESLPERPASGDVVSAAVASLEMLRLRAQYDTRLGLMTDERDTAQAEVAKLRKESASQIAIERRVAAEFSKKLSLCQKVLAECDLQREILRAERDALLAGPSELPLASTPPVAAPEPSEQAAWEARAAAQHEADMAVSRNRIEELLGERDKLRREYAELSACLVEMCKPQE